MDDRGTNVRIGGPGMRYGPTRPNSRTKTARPPDEPLSSVLYHGQPWQPPHISVTRRRSALDRPSPSRSTRHVSTWESGLDNRSFHISLVGRVMVVINGCWRRVLPRRASLFAEPALLGDDAHVPIDQNPQVRRIGCFPRETMLPSLVFWWIASPLSRLK